MSRRWLEWIALGALVLAAGVIVQPTGCNQTAHLSLIKSLADGTPRIDAYEAETCDDAWIDGHFYAAKAPGLALFATPWYLLLETTGLVSRNPAADEPWPDALSRMPRSAVWQIGLVGAVLPFAALLVLLRWSTSRLVPELGAPTAVAVGAGTLLLPFATVLFAHVLAAALLFGAFCLLLRERAVPPDARLVAAAGVVAGLAVVVEFPAGLGLLLLGGYALARQPRFIRALVYSAGAMLGGLPLIVFNTWAFGSPFELSYTNAVIEPGATGHEVVGANDRGFFGVEQPGLRDAAELLFSAKGLLVLSPVLAAGCVGLIVLGRRRGARAEAILAGVLALVFLAYNAAYYLPFGGWTPGPRFLVLVIPFLALGVAAALHAAPLATTALAGISIFWMAAATLAEPLIPNDDIGSWITRLRTGNLTYTVVGLVTDAHGHADALPFLLALGVSVGSAASLVRLGPVSRHQALLAVGAVTSWAITASAAPELLRTDRSVQQWTGLVTTVALVAVIGVILAVARHRGTAFLLALPLLLLLVPGFAEHTKWSLVVVLLAGGLLAFSIGREQRRLLQARRETVGS